MLSTRAHSFRKRAKLAVSLSWIGGYTNIICFLACGYVCSHISGTATFMSRALAEKDSYHAIFYFVALFAFLTGAVASALMTEVARRLGKRSVFILPISVEIVLLSIFASTIAFEKHVAPDDRVGLYVALISGTLAMGIQNATITRISGSVVRTTHLTGIVTDFGIESVQFLIALYDKFRQRRYAEMRDAFISPKVHRPTPPFERLALLVTIFVMFVGGAILGAWAYETMPRVCMLPPVFFLAFLVVLDWKAPIADVRRFIVGADGDLAKLGIVEKMLPKGLAVYQLFTPDDGRDARAPNFQLWAEQVPGDLRCVILRLDEHVVIDGNAALDLRLAAEQLQSRRQRLVVSVPTPEQARELDVRGVSSAIGPKNVHLDMKGAVARGIDLARDDRPVTQGFSPPPLEPI